MVKNRKLLAEQLVEESVVLLKNENQLLPLQEGQTVAVFGRSALVFPEMVPERQEEQKAVIS